MSTETSPAKPSPVAPAVMLEIKPQAPAEFALTQIDKPQPADKSAAAVASAPAVSHAPAPKAAEPKTVDPKAHALQLQVAELASSDSARRLAAAAELGRMADAAALPSLIVALHDVDADVARHAAASLGLLKNPAAVDPLIAVLANHDAYFHPVVRAAATQSLGQLRDPRAVPSLLAAIKDPIAETSAQAIQALATLNDPRSLPALLDVVRNEHNYYVATARHAAILGLAQMGGTQADCELKFVANNQWEDAPIRAAAIQALRESAPSAAKV